MDKKFILCFHYLWFFSYQKMKITPERKIDETEIELIDNFINLIK